MENLLNQNISTYWSLGGLLAYVLTQDVSEAQKWHDDADSAAIVGLLVSAKPFKRLPPVQNDNSSEVDTEIKDALGSVLCSLTKGLLRSKAIKPLRGPRVDIGPDEWVGRTFVFSVEQGDAADDVEYLGKQEYRWSHLLFSSSDAIDIWGPKNSLTEDNPPNSVTTHSVTSYDNLFIESGNMFEIVYEGERFHLNKTVGLVYISYLLSHPCQEIDAFDLRINVNPLDSELTNEELATYSSNELEVEGLTIGSWSEEGTKIDATTKRQIEYEFGRLQRLYDIATETGDESSQSELQEELEFYKSYLSGSVDIHGKLRKENSSLERNRKAVGKAISAAKKNIRKFSPALADHFDEAIVTGKSLKYWPMVTVTWNTNI